jgi:hypothetical protein
MTTPNQADLECSNDSARAYTKIYDFVRAFSTAPVALRQDDVIEATF